MSDSNQFKLVGIMGMPVVQSRSPILHNYWIRKYNLKGAYGHFPVQVENIETAIRGLSALGIAGCNITQPHKLLAMKLMDQLSPLAERIGAINCIVRQADGSLHGYNNDGIGFIQSLRDVKPNWRANEGPIVVLGSGGAARAVVISLLDEGAQEIRLINRTRAKADELAAVDPSVIKTYSWDERHAALAGAALLTNTTNQGMHGQPALDIRLDELPTSAMVSDLIYIPLETPLLAAARARGHVTVNGLGLLLNQAIPAFEAWFGVKPEITDELRNAVLATF
jgi:shikimate dehydrogenase